MPETAIQVNVSMDPETAGILDEMARQDGYDNRSAFVRWLIRVENQRRMRSNRFVLTEKGREALRATKGDGDGEHLE